jgi:aryl-alcohol dehydrogenase-like predicted oxidoreductase
VRQVITRFDKDNIRANQPLLDLITNVANSKGVTPAQISLAWMPHKNDFIVPIPGSRKLERIQENLGTADFDLTDDEFAQIEGELAKMEIQVRKTAVNRTTHHCVSLMAEHYDGYLVAPDYC